MTHYYSATWALAAALVALGFGAAPGPQFRQKLAEAHMTLTPPPGWVETPVFTNNWLPYDYALRYPGRRLEVRYIVEPLAPLVAEAARMQKNKKDVSVSPNELYQQFFLYTVLKVRGIDSDTPAGDAAARAEVAKALNTFPDKAVKTEFGADWGAVQPLLPSPEFGQNFKHCLLVALHKKNAADAYVIYLYDDQQDLTEVVMGDPQKLAFHSLRFQ